MSAFCFCLLHFHFPCIFGFAFVISIRVLHLLNISDVAEALSQSSWTVPLSRPGVFRAETPTTPAPGATARSLKPRR